MLNLFTQTNNLLVGLARPLVMGLEDGIGPTSIIGLVVVFLFLSFFGYGRGLILVFTTIYSISVVSAKLMIVFGVLDPWLADGGINSLIMNIYVVLGVIFTIVGCVHFLDWLLLKFKNKRQFFLPLPVFITCKLGESSQKKLSYFYVWILVNIIAFLGFAMTILGSIWTQDYELFLIVFLARPKDSVFEIYLETAAAGFMSVIPIMFLAVILWFILGSKQRRQRIYDHPDLLKIINAAIFIAVGIGTLYMFGYV